MKKIKRKLITILVGLMLTASICNCGPKIKNGFVNENGYTYYYVNDEKQTGWQEIDGEWYYFSLRAKKDGKPIPNGVMFKEEYYNDGENVYYLDKDGKMAKNDWVDHEIYGKRYFGENGAMLCDTQIDLNGKTYSFDSTGFARQVPNYQMIFNCQFPKAFREGKKNWSEVIIENVSYEVIESYEEIKFVTHWTGTAGNTFDGSHYNTTRGVGWKLYDPDNNVINSGSFHTYASLINGEKFKNNEKIIGTGEIKTKGVYKLELMDIE